MKEIEEINNEKLCDCLIECIQKGAEIEDEKGEKVDIKKGFDEFFRSMNEDSLKELFRRAKESPTPWQVFERRLVEDFIAGDSRRHNL